jgi:hypothetical protein
MHDLSDAKRLAPPAALLEEVLEVVLAEVDPLPELPHAASARQVPRTHSATIGRRRRRLAG